MNVVYVDGLDAQSVVRVIRVVNKNNIQYKNWVFLFWDDFSVLDDSFNKYKKLETMIDEELEFQETIRNSIKWYCFYFCTLFIYKYDSWW